MPSVIVGVTVLEPASADSAVKSLLRFFVSAAFFAASFLLVAREGSERPSVSQFGFGKLNREDLSDSVSSRFLAEADLVRVVCVSSLAVEADLGGMLAGDSICGDGCRRSVV